MFDGRNRYMRLSTTHLIEALQLFTSIRIHGYDSLIGNSKMVTEEIELVFLQAFSYMPITSSQRSDSNEL